MRAITGIHPMLARVDVFPQGRGNPWRVPFAVYAEPYTINAEMQHHNPIKIGNNTLMDSFMPRKFKAIKSKINNASVGVCIPMRLRWKQAENGIGATRDGNRDREDIINNE